ncbi:hypothetical protein BH11PSE12_BH11PSE12_08160 [soil metagenome]
MATLEQRITSLAQQVGTDIKALTASVLAMSGGAVNVKTSIINVPYDTEFLYTATIADAAIHAASIVIVSFGSTPSNAENDAEELADLTLVSNPVEAGIEITISGPGVFGGPIPINYLIGI